MIEASPVAMGMTERLVRKARALAETHLLQRRAGPARWRRPGLLWPLFAKER